MYIDPENFIIFVILDGREAAKDMYLNRYDECLFNDNGPFLTREDYEKMAVHEQDDPSRRPEMYFFRKIVYGVVFIIIF